jgi:hypothetical protein
MIKYLTFSFSIAFISWIVGMIVTALLSKKSFFKGFSSLSFIKNERINTLIGLKPFKWLIVHSFFKYFNPKLSVKKRILKTELEEYRAEMTTAELNHLFAFAFMGVFIIFKLFQGLYLFAAVMLLFNFLMNLYPSLLQQQNKRRIDRYLHILNQRS